MIIGYETLKLALLTSTVLFPIGLFTFFSKDFFYFLITPLGFTLLPLISLIYVHIKKKTSKSDYGLGSRLLHRVALGSQFVTEVSFDIERVTYKFDSTLYKDDKHVFISGLARSGTTLIMRCFYSSRRFASLTYDDMPFILMLNYWNNINSLFEKKSHKKERIHGDGLLVCHNSPEALEEVFWRTFARDEYIRSDKLIPMQADDEMIDHFRSYVASIITRYQKGSYLRYLSKNNNNILRLHSIRKAFPHALIIIPFRNPLQHANSLCKIHHRLIRAQNSDRFILKYMEWIGHYDFGLGHKPYCIGYDTVKYRNSEHLNYWLQLWCNIYGWLKESAPSSVIFLCFEDFCQNFHREWIKLTDLADISAQTRGSDIISIKTQDVRNDYDEALLDKANSIYNALLVQSRQYPINLVHTLMQRND